MKRFIYLIALTVAASSAHAAGPAIEYKDKEWPFEGVTGTFDRAAIQRGFQAYKEVCSACHGMKFKAYRNLTQIGFSEGEAKTIAAEYTVIDGPNDDGDMFERPARLSDKFASPFPNEQAARAANGGAYPVDLSLIIKARPDGADYVYSLMTGYQDAPEGFKLGNGMYYNAYYAGHQIAMPPQLSDGLIEYQDGTEATAEQIASDVVNFLQWAAEPEMEARKEMGLKVLAFLFVFTVLFYLAKKRIWGRLKDSN